MAHVSGSIGGVTAGTLARLTVMPDRRLPHMATAIGDSRVAALFLDRNQLSRAITSPLNWANALLGQRLTIGTGYGVSGERTDQMLARMAAVTASGAGLLYIQGGVNDIAQNYPAAATSGQTAFANIRTMADTARRAGMIVVVEAEVGADSLSAAMLAQVEELNVRLADYAERTPGIHLHDARGAVLQPGFGEGGVRYRTGYSYDGTHVNGRGAAAWGESLATLIDRLVPPRSGPLIRNRAQVAANGRRQIAANPLFATATGGAVQGMGASGTVPAGWTGVCAAGATAAFATQADPRGLGNDVVIDWTVTAANDAVRLAQTIDAASWRAGDALEGFAEVELVGNPTGLASCHLQLSHFSGTGGQATDHMDMIGPVVAGYGGLDRAMVLTLRTRTMTVPASVGSNPYLTVSIRLVALGAGSGRVIVRQVGVRRRELG